MTETSTLFVPKRLEEKKDFNIRKEGPLSPEEIDIAMRLEGLASLHGFARESIGPHPDDRNESTRIGLTLDTHQYIANITSIWSNTDMVRTSINLYEISSDQIQPEAFNLKHIEETTPVLSMEKRSSKETSRNLKYAIFYRDENIETPSKEKDYKKALKRLMSATPNTQLTLQTWMNAVKNAGVEKFEPFVEFTRGPVQVKIGSANRLKTPRVRF